VSNEEIDRALSVEDGIVPSSGFAFSVMDAVRCDAGAPPIAFPWKRALPGLVCCIALLAVLFTYLMRSSPSPGVPVGLPAILHATTNTPAGWVALALLASILSVAISLRAAGRGA
jgi:hypothetical protein